jgi:anti-sigma B factor antagonist
MVNIERETEGEVSVLQVAGEIDASSSIFLDEEIGRVLEHSAKIAVDLTSLEYISSAGLGVFMSYISDLESKKMTMVLFGMKEKVFQVFQILGLDQLLTIVDTREEAVIKANDL